MFLPAVSRPLVLALATLMILCACAISASAAGAADITGVAYKDLNRDGVKQAAEEPLVGKEIYAFDWTGRPVAHAPTDATGRYVIANLPSTTYTVRYGTSEWWELWTAWAPSTTGSERPAVTVQLTDAATVDFGWRPIVRSTDVAAPISTYLASDGLRVNSYNDVVSAKQIYDALALGSLRAGEAPYTTIRFDLRATSSCEASTATTNGVIGDYRAICEISYLKWLDTGDATLFHEYGHAWSLYYANIVRQDPALSAYLQARGVAGDPRLGTNEEWSPREMIAEDYRQLFGTANAAARTQANRDIPPASDVPGLRDFLAGPFMQPASSPPPPTTPPPSSGSTAIHVVGLQASSTKASRAWRASATVAVNDAASNAVAGAAVTMRWSNAKSGQSGLFGCTTAATGSCTAGVDLSTKVDSATLSVVAVAKDGAVYASDANVGASPVTVKRPK